MAPFQRVTIIGLGLIGGSLGLAIKRHRLAREVVGVSRKRATLQQAKRRRIIDVGTTSTKAGVQGADLVIATAAVVKLPLR